MTLSLLPPAVVPKVLIAVVAEIHLAFVVQLFSGHPFIPMFNFYNNFSLHPQVPPRLPVEALLSQEVMIHPTLMLIGTKIVAPAILIGAHMVAVLLHQVPPSLLAQNASQAHSQPSRPFAIPRRPRRKNVLIRRYVTSRARRTLPSLVSVPTHFKSQVQDTLQVLPLLPLQL